MKKGTRFMRMIWFLITLFLFGCMNQSDPEKAEKITAILDSLEWKGYCSYRLVSEGQNIYFDPWYNLTDNDNHTADIIFISHYHNDYIFSRYIDRLVNNETILIMTESDASFLKKTGTPYNITGFLPEEKKAIKNLQTEAVRAYDLKLKHVSVSDHPRQYNWLGYIINLNGIRVYYTGGTQLIPEMKNIHCNILIGNLYLNEEDPLALATLAKWTGAQVVIPTSYWPSTEADEIIKKVENGLNEGVRLYIPELKQVSYKE